jgi:putative DNA methylase
MNQKDPKRLIEVDLPIRRISAHARREKSIRHGHISTLHIWWARRPLAACRAVICASLWPDPADPLCPQSFRDRASRVIFDFASAAAHSRELGESCDHETWIKWQAMAQKGALDSHNEAHWNILRFALFDFIADFANWDNSTVKEYLDTSRALTQAAHEALGGEPGTRPLVVDPFAGGGSIPLEALRVGADAFASDLNPIPVLLNKVILEYVPKYGQRLTDEVRKCGEWISQQISKNLAPYYPPEADGTRSAGYLWARTILSEAPSEDEIPVEVPILRSMWLSSKPSRRFAFRWVRDKNGHIRTKTVKAVFADGSVRLVRRPEMEIFTPTSPSEVDRATSAGGAVTCPVSGFTTSVERVRDQLSKRRGGGADARLLCVVTSPERSPGKVYRLPNSSDTEVTVQAAADLDSRVRAHDSSVSLLPDGKLNHLRGFFNVVLYGMTTWGDLFTPRQALSLTHISSLIGRVGQQISDKEFAVAVKTCLAMSLGRCADKCASVVVWNIPAEKIEHVFGRQALPMVWDFAEANILSDIGWTGACEWVQRVLERDLGDPMRPGSTTRASATEQPLPDDFADAVITDPPYYAAIPYADLSDFFYSWFKRSIGGDYPDLLSDPLSPKDDECVQLSHRAAMYRHKDAKWFEETMTRACAENRRVTKPSGISLVVFANKETSGWEAMLQALVSSRWTITASWPIDTERSGRLRAMDSAALASSVHLVCRPREDFSLDPANSTGDWRDILAELPRRIHDWMPRLAAEGVVGADAIFACLGPALEIFSRYSRVEKANGDTVTLREYLEQVWAAVAKEALAQVFKGADATGFEPDARLTAMWLWTLNAPTANGKAEGNDEQDTDDEEPETKKPKAGGFRLEYDAARKIAQGLGAVLENLPHLVELKGEEARLLPVAERTRHLFGKDQEDAARPSRKKASAQLNMFAELTGAEDAETAWQEKTVTRMGDTTLDRVHQAMILFAAARGDALKRFVVDDGVGRDGKFWRLAQALSALYPAGTEERRWVEGVMARKKQFGF